MQREFLRSATHSDASSHRPGNGLKLVAACAAVAAVLAATASPAVRTAAADSPQSCSNPVQIGMLGPFTGPAASIGSDQLHWAQFFVSNWNKTHKLQLSIVQGDTQLDPAKASKLRSGRPLDPPSGRRGQGHGTLAGSMPVGPRVGGVRVDGSGPHHRTDCRGDAHQPQDGRAFKV